MVSINGGTVYATGGEKGTHDKSVPNCGIGTDADTTGSILTITGGSLKAVAGGSGAVAIAGATPTNGSANVELYTPMFPPPWR